MKIGLGSDHNAYVMKEEIKAYVQTLGYEVHDYGCSSCTEVDYPDVAFRVAGDILSNKIARGILICGTGIGVAIAAGKVLVFALPCVMTLIQRNGHRRVTMRRS